MDLGIRHFLRSLGINIMLMIQLALMFVLAGFVLSSFDDAFRYYTPFKDVLQKKGVYAIIGSNRDFINDAQSPMFLCEKDEIIENLPDTSDALLTYQSYVTTPDNSFLEVRGYDSEIIKRFQPTLESGNWLKDSKQKDYTIDVVLSVNPWKYKTGDIIDVTAKTVTETDINLKMRVVGILQNKARIFGSNQWSVMDTYIELYQPYNYEQEEVPIALADVSQINNLGISKIVTGTAIFTFDESVTNEQYLKNLDYLSKYSIPQDLHKLNLRSLEAIKIEVMRLLPMAISIVIIVLLGIFCVSAIKTRLQLRNYGVYFLLGSTWRKNLLITIIETLITLLFANTLALLSIYWINVGDSIKVSLTSLFFVMLLGLSGFTLLLSLIMPYRIFKNYQPVTIIRQMGSR